MPYHSRIRAAFWLRDFQYNADRHRAASLEERAVAALKLTRAQEAVDRCKIFPTNFLFVLADREHQNIVSMLPCFPQKNNADPEKYNSVRVLWTVLRANALM